MKRSYLTRNTPLRAKTALRATQGTNPHTSPKKRSGGKLAAKTVGNLGMTAALKLPWVRAVPISPWHGTGNLQKKLWRMTSDYCRLRDWYAYEGKCAATGKYIAHWTQGSAGHFKPFSKCNGLARFDTDNIFLQSNKSNKLGDYDEWKEFELELERRGYSPENFALRNRDTPLKFSTQDVLDKMSHLLILMEKLEEKPDYFPRVWELKNK